MTTLLHTPLHSAHLESSAKMVDFGGWHMPVQYEGILAEHKAVREKMGMFDVSHMGEIDFRGPKAIHAMQKLITNDPGKLTDGRALYTAICYPDGGIVDDCIVYRFSSEHFRIVVNASNIDKDDAFFREHAGKICPIENNSDKFALIAVQGPQTRDLVAKLAGPQTLDIPAFGFASMNLSGTEVVAARTGYTGEDGYELFVPSDNAQTVWKVLRENGVTPCGLGARDTLRLEAKLCLYGNDIDANTNPYEACLGWVVKLDHGDFVGREALVKIKEQGPKRKLIGFRILGRGIARPGAEVLDENDNRIGSVTSGSVAPTVGGAVGMGYVESHHTSPHTKIKINHRGKSLEAEVVKGPFYNRS